MRGGGYVYAVFFECVFSMLPVCFHSPKGNHMCRYSGQQREKSVGSYGDTLHTISHSWYDPVGCMYT